MVVLSVNQCLPSPFVCRLCCKTKTWELHVLYMQAKSMLQDMLQRITHTVLRNEYFLPVLYMQPISILHMTCYKI